MQQQPVQGKLATYQFGYVEKRFQIVQYANNNFDKKFMISARDPDREAERLLGNFQLKKGMLAVVAGAVQLPLLLKLRNQKLKEGGFVILLEADNLLLKSLKEFNP